MQAFQVSLPSFRVRLIVGGGILLCLAAYDLARNRRQATRWREYLFLLSVSLAAMAYGAVNDLITSRISWEYYYWGKGLADVLGPKTPPDRMALAREAVKIGLQAAWSAGLLIGVALLIANNPRKGLPQLSYRRLFGRVGAIFVFTVPVSVLLGILGGAGALTWVSADFRELVRDDLYRPYRMMTVFGVHLGAYLGGAVGTGWAVISVRQARGHRSVATDEEDGHR